MSQHVRDEAIKREALAEYEKYDRYEFVWEPGGWRVHWKVIDTHLPPEPNAPGHYHRVAGEDGRLCRIIAEGKAWSLDGARRKAYIVMEEDMAIIDGEVGGMEKGAAVATRVEAQRRADMFP